MPGDPGITYAGQALIQPTPDLLAWAASLPFPEGYHWPTKADWNKQDRLQRLWWPTGASRWAEGWFLADGPTIDQIKQATDGGKNEQDLVVNDGVTEITAGMLMLPPVPLTAQPLSYAPGQGKLWLLPLVDDRYRWSWLSTATLTVTEGDSWTTVLNAVASLLGVSFTNDTVNGAYLSAPAGLLDSFESAPAFLDRILFCLGMRLVRHPDGTVETLTVGTSAARLQNNIQNLAQVAWGGLRHITQAGSFTDSPGVLPASVQVVFQRVQDGAVTANDNTKVVAVPGLDAADLGSRVGAGTVDIHALEPAKLSGAVWTNSAACASLATQFAKDWCRYQTATHDILMRGTFAWQMEGLSDWVEWNLAADDWHTRARRPPYDVRQDVKERQGGNSPDLAIVKITSNLSGGLYPGQIATWDPVTLAVTLGAAVMVKSANTKPADWALDVGTYVECEAAGNNGTDDIWVTTDGGYTGDVTLVTDVQCVDGVLYVFTKTLTFENGHLISVADGGDPGGGVGGLTATIGG